MIKSTRTNKVDTVFVLIIFCVFAVSVLLVLALSASIYRNMTELSRDGYDERTALSYVWTMVKNGDEAGRISVGEFHGISTLIIDEMYGQTLYRTRIYEYEGRLNVLFSEAGLEFLPQQGVSVLEIDNIMFEQLDNRLIRVTAGAGSMLITQRGVTGTPYERITA